MIPGNCGDFGCVVGYRASERAERECGPSAEVNPGNGFCQEIRSQIHTSGAFASGAFAAAPALRTRVIETSENSARLIVSSRQPASIAACVRLSRKRARGQHAFEPAHPIAQIADLLA
jgi:hypothetical protein